MSLLKILFDGFEPGTPVDREIKEPCRAMRLSAARLFLEPNTADVPLRLYFYCRQQEHRGGSHRRDSLGAFNNIRIQRICGCESTPPPSSLKDALRGRRMLFERGIATVKTPPSPEQKHLPSHLGTARLAPQDSHDAKVLGFYDVDLMRLLCK